MRKKLNFNDLAFFNNNLSIIFKNVLTSDYARLAFWVTLMSIGLYIMQYFKFFE